MSEPPLPEHAGGTSAAFAEEQKRSDGEGKGEAGRHSLQLSSSELSPQSFWLSHLQWSGMQLLFSQRNS